jgi:hypothetical protein
MNGYALFFSSWLRRPWPVRCGACRNPEVRKKLKSNLFFNADFFDVV